MTDPADPAHASPRRMPHLNLLVLAALPLLLWFLHGSGGMRLSAVLQVLLLIAAIRLIGRGDRLHRAWALSNAGKPPRVPRKIVGSGLIGLAVLLMAGHRFATLEMPILLALAAFGLGLLAFGPDPLRRKPAAASAPATRTALLSRFESTLAEAEARIAALDEEALRRATTAFGDHAASRLHRIAGTDRARLEALRPLLDRAGDHLLTEIRRLEQGDRGPFAQRRYLAKLEIMRESFDARLAGDPADRPFAGADADTGDSSGTGRDVCAA